MQSTDAFLVLPQLEHDLDRTTWHVTNLARYWSARFGVGVSIAPGFETDLASVPRLVWLLIPRDDKNIVEAAVFHDWLYATHGEVGVALYQPGVWLTRRQCDRLLSDAMIVAGAPWWKRHVVYWAVRLGGWKPWRADARRERGIKS